MRKILLGIILSIISVSARAEDQGRLMQRCMSQIFDQNQIDACTALIEKPSTPNDYLRIALINRAQGLLMKNDLKGVIADLTRAISLDPNDPQIYSLRAFAYQQSGNIAARDADGKMAVAAATQAIANHPTANVYNDRAVGYITLNRLQEALADANRAIELDSDRAENLTTRGQIHERMDDHDAAIADYKAALRLNPSLASAQNGLIRLGVPRSTDVDWLNCASLDRSQSQIDACSTVIDRKGLAPEFRAAVFENRAWGYFAVDALDHAIADLTQAIALTPESAFDYSLRSDAYRSANQIDKAIDDANRAIAISPSLAIGYQARGYDFLGEGQYDAALADAAHVIELAPDGSTGYMIRGDIEMRNGQIDQAIADFTRAIALDSGNMSEAHRERAEAYIRNGQLNPAIADANEAINLSPLIDPAYITRGTAFGMQGHLDASIADFTSAISRRPTALAYHNRALSFYRKGNLTDALSDATKSVALSPKDPNNWVGRARIYQKMGRFDDAVADANQMIALNPLNSSAYEMRAEFYEQSQRRAAAIADYRKAVGLNPQYQAAMAGLARLGATP
jgi:tetratricopeptide (TPR) repeat protein